VPHFFLWQAKAGLEPSIKITTPATASEITRRIINLSPLLCDTR
jgi:hypothetical protein